MVGGWRLENLLATRKMLVPVASYAFSIFRHEWFVFRDDSHKAGLGPLTKPRGYGTIFLHVAESHVVVPVLLYADEQTSCSTKVQYTVPVRDLGHFGGRKDINERNKRVKSNHSPCPFDRYCQCPASISNQTQWCFFPFGSTAGKSWAMGHHPSFV